MPLMKDCVTYSALENMNEGIVTVSYLEDVAAQKSSIAAVIYGQ